MDLLSIISITITGTIDDTTYSVLHISTVESYQYGTYSCKATNKLGTDEKKLELFGKYRAYFGTIETYCSYFFVEEKLCFFIIVQLFAIYFIYNIFFSFLSP